MTVLKVPGMHCEGCVKRIENALREAEIQGIVSLAEKTVSVDGCEDCVKTAISEIEDLGFEVSR